MRRRLLKEVRAGVKKFAFFCYLQEVIFFALTKAMIEVRLSEPRCSICNQLQSRTLFYAKEGDSQGPFCVFGDGKVFSQRQRMSLFWSYKNFRQGCFRRVAAVRIG